MNDPRTRILIVDDEPDHRLLMQALLSEFISPGLDLLEASNGQEAIHLFQAAQPQMILMDLWMPGIAGDEAVRQIRVIEQDWRNTYGESQSVPASVEPTSVYPVPAYIVAVTAASFECDRDRAAAAGCDDFISKPIDFETFLGQVSRLLSMLNTSPYAMMGRSPLNAPARRLYAVG